MHIVIASCSDSLLWYCDLIGQIVPLVRDLPTEMCWLCREPDGLANVVRYRDGAIVPQGYAAADRGTHLQHHDLLYINGQWSIPTLHQLGTPVRGHCVIRKVQP